MKIKPDISFVIVNYNSGSFLPACIESILAQSLTEFEIILVDNASVDHSLSFVPRDSRIHVYKNFENLGYAKAQNQGMLLAKGRYLIPLNFDVLLESTFLAEMVSSVDTSERIGSVAPKMLRMTAAGKKSKQIDNAGILLPNNFYPHQRGRDEYDHGQYDEPVRVFSTTGGVALYRREMLDDIVYQNQYFDESYFMWYEDIDLEWRARLRGWDCLYNPRAIAYHVGDPHGHNRSEFGAQVSMRNRWMMILTNENLLHLLCNTGPILRVELGLINHVIKKRLIVSYFKALVSLIKLLPQIYRKRHWIKSQTIISCLPDFPLPIK